MMKDWIAMVMPRELKALRREVESYPSDAELWESAPGITNPGGNLVLHLAGNIQYFLGAVLGGSGYKRYRDAEFGSRDVPRADLLREIDGAIAAVATGLARVSDADLKKQLRALGFMTRDSRAVERKKPGLKKARRAPQWAKR